LALVQSADAAGLQAAGKEFALDFASGWREPTPGAPDSRDSSDQANVETIEFRGYAYTRKPSEISGDLVTVYDPTSPQIWRVPFRKNTAPSLTVKAPSRGYLIPISYAKEIGDKLTLHGVAFEMLEQDKAINVEAFRVIEAKFSATPFEGRMRVTLQGGWQRESHAVPQGSLFVPIAQPRARLLMALLEPQAPDSLAAWGFFNGWFEQKEHTEPYVAEQIARDMLKSDSRLAEEFKLKLASDNAFAKDPTARLSFFLHRHASRDERFNLYPILRL
jgi:hypothetical protein